MNTRYRCVLLTASATLCIAASAAHSQTVAEDSSNQGIQDIVVTAQKRSESAQSVPITLNAFSQEGLRTSGVTSLQGLEHLVPGAQLTSYSAIRPDFFIRGIGSSQVTTVVDHSVGVFVDEVYVPRIGAAQIGIGNAERIEVLKGPQGTLFGRNTAAGAVSITTPTPTDKTEGFMEARLGSFRGIGGSAALSGGLADDVAGRVYVDYAKNRGYTKNLTNGHYGNGDNTVFVSTKLVYSPGDAKFTFNLDYSHSDLPGEFDLSGRDSLNGGLQALQSPNTPLYQYSPKYNQEFLNFDPFTKRTVWRGYVRGEIPFGFANLVSLTSYYNTKIAEQVESDGTNLRLWSFEIKEKSNTYSQEFRLVSNDDSPLTFGGNAHWVLGAYYYNDYSDRTDFIHTYEDSVFNDFGFPQTTSFHNIRIKVKSIATYGQYDIEVLPGLSAAVGARYTHDKKTADVDAGNYDLGYGPGGGTIAAPYSIRNLSASWSSFDPKATISYKPMRGVMLYAIYSKGFKSGGFQTLSSNALAGSVISRPEKVTNLEAGIKSQWFDNRLQVNLAIFKNKYKDLQLQHIVGITNPATGTTSFEVITDNAAQADVKGGEADVKLRVLDGLTLSANYSHVDGTYKNFLTVGAGGVPIDLSGTPLRNAPRNTYGFAVDGEHDVGNFRLSAHVDYTHKSTVYFDVFGKNTQSGLTQRPLGLVNGRVAIAMPDSGWELALSGRNLTNKKYKLMGFALGDGGVSNFTPAAPASWELSLKKKF